MENKKSEPVSDSTPSSKLNAKDFSANHLRPILRTATVEQIEEEKRKEADRLEREIHIWKCKIWECLISSVGCRYAPARFENYACKSPGQQNAVDALIAYADESANLDSGKGVMLYGPAGTGKDHLLIALAHKVIGKRRGDVLFNQQANCETGRWYTPRGMKQQFSMEWLSGVEFYSALRSGMNNKNFDEESFIYSFTSPAVLIISDPIPPRGSLTDYQASMLLDVIDGRYRNRRTIWTTLNVATPREAEERLTPQIVDRLKDGSICIHCNWPSHRKVEQNVITK